MNYLDALKVASANKSARSYPGQNDPRYVDNFFTPKFVPKFGIDFLNVNSVFTIGSCFARNVEEILEPMGVLLPTKKFVAPKTESPYRANGLLNEFNPGSISQKILSTLNSEPIPTGTIIKQNELCQDLLLAPPAVGVTFERAIERRTEISKIYERLIDSEVVIVTLGFIEAWYDNETNQWLNRMPPRDIAINPHRYVFRVLNVNDTMDLLSESLGRLDSMNKKVVLTVSPVPLQTTFTNNDCVVANEFSKSVLRVCAENLKNNFKNIDYYPSYEMVRTIGLSAYEDDHVHVKYSLIKKVTSYMVAKYQEAVQ